MQSKRNSKRNSSRIETSKKNTMKFKVPPLDDFEIELIEPQEDNDNNNDDENMLLKYVNMDASADNIKWSRMDEKTVNKYIQKAIGYKTLYNDTYFVYMFYNNLIKYPLIVLTGISIVMQTVFATIIQSTTPDICNCTADGTVINNAGIFSITSACLSALVSILTYVHSSFGYAAIAQGSRDAAVAFSEFADDLRTLLSFPRHIRANPFTVINTIQSDYKKLLKTYSKYPIPVSVYHKFARNSSNKHIVSDIVDNTDADQFDLHDGELERNIITEKFVDNIRNIRNTVPPPLPTERFTRRNTTLDLRNKSGTSKPGESTTQYNSASTKPRPTKTKEEQDKISRAQFIDSIMADNMDRPVGMMESRADNKKIKPAAAKSDEKRPAAAKSDEKKSDEKRPSNEKKAEHVSLPVGKGGIHPIKEGDSSEDSLSEVIVKA